MKKKKQNYIDCPEIFEKSCDTLMAEQFKPKQRFLNVYSLLHYTQHFTQLLTTKRYFKDLLYR